MARGQNTADAALVGVQERCVQCQIPGETDDHPKAHVFVPGDAAGVAYHYDCLPAEYLNHEEADPFIVNAAKLATGGKKGHALRAELTKGA